MRFFTRLSTKYHFVGGILVCLWFTPSFAAGTEERGASSFAQDPISSSAMNGSDTNHSMGFDFAGYPFVHGPWKDRLIPSFNLHLKDRSQSAWFESGGEVSVQLNHIVPSSTALFFELNQAYLATSSNLGPVQLQFGRRIEHWSHLDDQWQFGIWQPRFRWDFIRPEQVGLLGATLAVKSPSFEWLVLASPVFIPERGVPISVENGAVISQSPWFLPPPNKVAIMQEVTPVQYNIVLPPVMDIVMHSGVSTRMKLGGEIGPWVSLAYAYKPMNQLLLAYDGYLQLDGKGPEVAHATIFPRVTYHHLTSLELGYERSDLSACLSLLSERPVADAVSPQWTTQEAKPAYGVSPTLDLKVGGSEAEPIRVNMSYLRIWGGNAPDGGEFSTTGSVFESRYPFDHALSVGMVSSLSPLSPALSRIKSSTRILGDLTNQGYIFSTEFRYRARSSWELALGADILGSDQPSSGPDEGANFIGRYRNNDRFHAGVTYVF